MSAEAYIPLVRTIAANMKLKNKGVEFDELYQDGMVGLMQALKSFRDDGKASEGAWIYKRVWGEMLDGMRSRSKRPRHHAGIMRKWREAEDRIWTKEQQEPDSESLARQLGMTMSEYRLVQMELLAYYPVELGYHQPSIPEHTIEHLELREVIDSLKPGLKRVVEEFFFDGRDQKEIGCRMGVDNSWISRLIKEALAEMKLKLGDSRL